MHHPKKLCEGAAGLDSFVENSSQYLSEKVWERPGLCLCSILSLLSRDYFNGSSHVCAAEPKVNCTPSVGVLFTKRRVGGVTLSCSHSFGLILNISGSKTETRKAEFSCFIFVCNLQMLFLPFQKDWYTKKNRKKKKKSILIFAGSGSCLSITGVVFIS